MWEYYLDVPHEWVPNWIRLPQRRWVKVPLEDAEDVLLIASQLEKHPHNLGLIADLVEVAASLEVWVY